MSINIQILEIQGIEKSANDAFVSLDANVCFTGVEIIGSYTNLPTNVIHKLSLTDVLPLDKEFPDEIEPPFIVIPKNTSSGTFKFDLRLQETPYHLYSLALTNAEDSSGFVIAEEEFGIECGSDPLPLLTPTPTQTITSTSTSTPTSTVTPTNSQALLNVFDSNVILEKDEYLLQTDRTNWTKTELIEAYPFIDILTDTFYIRKPHENLIKKIQFDGENSRVVDYILVPSQTPTSTLTPTTTPSFTPTNTETPTVTPTNTCTPTNTPSLTATHTNTASNTPTNTVTITNTLSGSQLVTRTPTGTVTPTLSNTPTNTASHTITPTPTVTETQTSTPTPTNTLTPTLSNTPTNTTTITNTPSQTFTQTNTGSVTQTPTITPTNTNTPSFTPTHTNTASPTPTLTHTSTTTVTPTDVSPYNIEIDTPSNKIINCNLDANIAVFKYNNVKTDNRLYNWSVSSRSFSLNNGDVVQECSVSPSAGSFYGNDPEGIEFIEVILSDFAIVDNTVVLTITTEDTVAGVTTQSDEQILICEG
jgi:hypothetical protein